ncbi:MAG: hypothetical protein AAGK04_04865 [Planctomycetota bacterium]
MSTHGHRPHWRAWAAAALSALALGAVLVVLLRQREIVLDSLDAMGRAPWWMVAIVVASPIANWWIVAASFWIMNDRWARTGLGETGALIGSAWLLNFLPLRPGMIGRVAYHKRFHGIAVRDSIRVLIELTALGGVSMVVVLAAALASDALGQPDALWWGAMTLGILGLAGVGWALRLAGRTAWRWFAVASLRLADVLVWVVRYAVLFAMVGAPVSVREAAMLAIVSQIVLLVPISGNGLGLREAAVGALAGLAPGLLAIEVGDSSAESRAAFAAAADLVHRGIEVALAIPVGLVCTAWVGRRVARGGTGA